MARILKEDEYNAKRNEILDMARHLIYTKGYQQMTVQDVLDGLHISKGALYHYFASKEAMLAALIDRMEQEALQNLLPIARNPELTAIEKFRHYFEDSARWKSTQKELIIGILHMWFSNENAIIRQKLSEESVKMVAGIFETTICQGIAEGAFATPYPHQVALIIAGISLSLSDSIIAMILSTQVDRQAIKELEDTMSAYMDSIERILSVPAGTFHVFEPGAFDDWILDVRPAGDQKPADQ